MKNFKIEGLKKLLKYYKNRKITLFEQSDHLYLYS